MHQVFVAEGLILSKRGAGESNTLVALLTDERGLLKVSARSARKEASKLRYGLEPMTCARYSLVRGRNEWKLTGVEGVSREFLLASAGNRRRIGSVTRLLLRLIHGEEKIEGLFSTVLAGLSRLAEAPTKTEAEAIECVLVLRILAHLGYLPHRPELARFLGDEPYTPELAYRASESKLLLIKAINESLGATGL